MSAYTTIKEVARQKMGDNIANLVDGQFNNLKCMDKIRCPVLFIHGKADDLINCSHSKQLFNQLKS